MEKEESLFNAVSYGELFIVKGTLFKWWISCNICKYKFENLNNFLNHIINSHLNKHLDDTLQTRTGHCSIENTNTISIEDKVIVVVSSTGNNRNSENNQNVGRSNESNIENKLGNKNIGAIENNESDIKNEIDNKNAETIENNESDIENEVGNKNTRIIENNDSKFNIVAKSLIDLDLKFENSSQKLEVNIDKKGERHPCPHCEKIYSSKRTLKPHIKTHFLLDQLYKCEECGATLSSKRSLKFHMRLHTGERPEKCNICSKTFRLASTLRIHLMIHKGIKKFSCSFCEKKFRIKATMQIHERVHKGEKPAVCDICGGTFRCNAVLKTHIKNHAKIDAGQTISFRGPNKNHRFRSNTKVNSNEEKKFQCEICLAYFSSACGLMLHKQTHSASKKYLCRYCDNGFRTYSGLIYHMVKEHECKPIPQKNYTVQHNDGMLDEFLPVKPKEERPFVCKTCGTKHANQKALKMHEKFHAETKDYKCNMCGECFRAYADINYHMRKKHDCLAKANSNYTLNGGTRRK